MPKEIEDKLKKIAEKKKDWSKEHKDRYIYGTLAKLRKKYGVK